MAKMDFAEFRKQFETNNYDVYRVRMKLKDIAGGTPANPDIHDAWINKTNKEISAEERAKLVQATREELPEIAEELKKQNHVTFKVENGRPYLEGRCVKAALKEAANIVKNLVPSGKRKKGKEADEEASEEMGVTALKSKVADRVFVVEDKIFFTRQGQPVTTKEYVREQRPIHVMTPQGERTSIKSTDLLENVEVEFTVRLLRSSEVSQTALYSCLAYIPQLGLGADRSQGRGTSADIQVELLTERAA